MVFLCFCVKPPAPEAQLDDAIGFLRDHVEVNVSACFLYLNFINKIVTFKDTEK